MMLGAAVNRCAILLILGTEVIWAIVSDDRGYSPGISTNV